MKSIYPIYILKSAWLQESNRTKLALVPLIKRIAMAGRFRLDVNYAISLIAGERKAYKPKEWIAWYKKDGKAFQVDAAKSKAYRVKVRLQDVGVPVLGDSKVYTYIQ